MRDINLQRRLLAKPNLSLQMALDEAQATEISNQSTAAIQKSNSPPLRRAVTVYHDNMERNESTNDEGEVCRLHSTKRQNPATEKKQTAWVGCAACRYKDTICQWCDRKGHLARVCCASQPATFRADQPTTYHANQPASQPRAKKAPHK